MTDYRCDTCNDKCVTEDDHTVTDDGDYLCLDCAGVWENGREQANALTALEACIATIEDLLTVYKRTGDESDAVWEVLHYAKAALALATRGKEA